MGKKKQYVTCITINTDASFNPEYKIGGYAFYIVCDLFKIQKVGNFKRPVKTALEAEMMCMGNAFATLLAQPELPKAKWLIVNNDCIVAMDRIRKQHTALGKEISKIFQKLVSSLESKKNKFRHVKAHNGTSDARSWINGWCDKEAKKWMRKAVNDHKNKLENETI